MSNYYAKRIAQLALFALSNTRRRDTTAPILHAPVAATSKPFSTAALPARQNAPTVEKPIRVEAGTALNACPPSTHYTPQSLKNVLLP